MKKTRRQATNPSSECDSPEKREERAETKIRILLFYCENLLHNFYVKCTYEKHFNKPAHFLKTTVNLSAFFVPNK